MKSKESIFFYLLFCVALALQWFFHFGATRFDDRNELWSDRAGYYIYLPALYFHHFDARSMPADLDIRTGGGFSIDTARNKIDTKYTYGVALLQSPFFVAAGLISRIAGYHSEGGFSMIYIRMLGLAAVVYLVLGLWLLKLFLEAYFRQAVAYLTVTLIFLGTNLFYYSLIDGMMSHVYSFFLLSLFLYAMKRFLDTGGYGHFVLSCIALAIAILVRPVNFIPGLLFFTWDTRTFAAARHRLRLLLKPAFLPVLLAILFVLFLPQMVYWHYLSGHWIHFSYRGEGFANWRSPRVLEVLFSPVNGLFTNTPMALAMAAGILTMLFRRSANAKAIAFQFVAVTLVCASWKMWYFGCSFGQRSFVEYYAILAVPLAFTVDQATSGRRRIAATAGWFVLLFTVYFNLRYTVATYRFDRCYYGSTWDWDYYCRALQKAGILQPETPPGSYVNDFENLALSPVKKPSVLFTRSGQYSVATSAGPVVTPLWSARLGEFRYPYPKFLTASVWLLKNSQRPTGAALVWVVAKGGKALFSDRAPIDSTVTETGTWCRLTARFILPDVTETDVTIGLGILNPERASLFADDLRLDYGYSWKEFPVAANPNHH